MSQRGLLQQSVVVDAKLSSLNLNSTRRLLSTTPAITDEFIVTGACSPLDTITYDH